MKFQEYFLPLTEESFVFSARIVLGVAKNKTINMATVTRETDVLIDFFQNVYISLFGIFRACYGNFKYKIG
jgi:hypothetical protein